MTCQKPGFSHAIFGWQVNTINGMKWISTLVASVVTVGSAYAGSAPLDFSYRVTGNGEIRPMLVFNDGEDTFIQPKEGVLDLLVNGERPLIQGPYFVVKGVQDEILLFQGRKAVIKIVRAKPTREVPPADKPTATATQLRGLDQRKADGTSTAKCEPKLDHSDSAFVVSFRKGASTLTDLTQLNFRKFIGEVGNISAVQVIAEGESKDLTTRRIETIGRILGEYGIGGPKVSSIQRAPSVVGTEIHVHRLVPQGCATASVAPQATMAQAATKPMTGRFVVTEKSEAQTQAPKERPSVMLTVGVPATPSEIQEMRTFGRVTIITDGTAEGGKKALRLQDLLGKDNANIQRGGTARGFVQVKQGV